MCECLKGAKCGPGCNCKNCNNVTVRSGDPGTQPPTSIELDELEQEELLQDEVLTRKEDEQCVNNSDCGEVLFEDEDILMMWVCC